MERTWLPTVVLIDSCSQWFLYGHDYGEIVIYGMKNKVILNKRYYLHLKMYFMDVILNLTI